MNWPAFSETSPIISIEVAYEETCFRKRRIVDCIRRGVVPCILLPDEIHYHCAGIDAGAGRYLVDEMLMGGSRHEGRHFQYAEVFKTADEADFKYQRIREREK